MDNKSARSIQMLLHGWSINRPAWFDCGTDGRYIGLGNTNLWKTKTCLSILDLVHKRRNWISWFSALKIIYIYIYIYTFAFCCGWRRSFNSQPGRHEYQRKKFTANSKHGKTPCQVKVCKKLSSCPAESIKTSAAKRLNTWRFQQHFSFVTNEH